MVQRHTGCFAWRAALPWNLWNSAEINGGGKQETTLEAKTFVAKNGRSALGLVQVRIYHDRLMKSMFVLRAVSYAQQGGLFCVLSSCAGCWPQDGRAAEPQSSFSGWICFCDLVFLRTQSSGTASSPFSLFSVLPCPLYLSRSAVCQCREINRAWPGCCGLLFACLYIQKLSICSEQISMALMIGKEKKQTPVIKC